MAGAVALVTWRLVDSPSSGNRGLVALFGGMTVLVLALGLVQWSTAPVGWSIAGLAVTYAVGLPVHAGSLGESAGYGVGMFLVAETAYLCLERVPSVRGERGTVRGRLTLVFAVALGAVVMTELAYGAAYASQGGGLLLTAAVTAGLILVGGVAALVSVTSDRPPAPVAQRADEAPADAAMEAPPS